MTAVSKASGIIKPPFQNVTGNLTLSAMQASAASVIFVHNHPSGDTQPSEDDIKLTQRLVKAGEIVGVDVLDHVIIGDKDYFSLKRKGLF